MGEIISSQDPRDNQPIIAVEGETEVVGKVDSRYMRPIGKVERDTGEHHKVMVSPGLEAATKKATDEFNQEQIAAEMAKREAAQEANAARREVEADILNYLNEDRSGDDCPTPVCVPRFELSDDGFEDDEVTPVEIPHRFISPKND